MYEKFYGFTAKPFTIQPDPAFLYMGQRHAYALAALECGVRNQAAFALICGEIGSGKTTLVHRLLDTLENDVRPGLISLVSPEMDDPLEWILMAFGLPFAGLSKAERFDSFQASLLDTYRGGRRTLLIVDEAQNLNFQALETLRMLSNINAGKDQLLQTILVGQPQLKAILSDERLRQFAQRVGVQCYLPSLPLYDVARYIDHRLRVAGREELLFEAQAVARIATVSDGVPRTINVLCDTALVYGFAADANSIGLAIVEEMLSDRREFGVLA